MEIGLSKKSKKELDVVEKFVGIKSVVNLLSQDWFKKGKETHKKFFEKAKGITDFEKAKIFIAEEFIKKSRFAYKTLLSVDDFALLEMLKPEFKEEMGDIDLRDILISYFDPEYFLRKFFKKDYYFAPKQLEILRTIRVKDYLSVRSNTASGKSFILSRIAFWWVITHKNSKVVMTSVTARQAINILWSEFKTAYYEFSLKYPKFSKHLFANTPKTLSYYQGVWNLSKGTEEWQVLCFSVKEWAPESLQGFHAKFVMAIVDEASGIDERLYHGLDRILTGSQVAKYILISNPTRKEGYFYQTQIPKDENDVWTRIHISAFDSPNVILEYFEHRYYKKYLIHRLRFKYPRKAYPLLNIDKLDMLSYVPGLVTLKDVIKYIHLYGKDSDKFRIDILGEFPQISGDYLVNRDEIQECFFRTFPIDYTKECQFGIDVATGSTDSKSAFAFRIGNSLIRIGLSQSKEYGKIFQDFLEFVASCPKPTGFNLKEVPILIDKTGIGFGFFELFKNQGYKVDGFLGSSKSVKFLNLQKYFNRRTEAFFNLIGLIKNKNIFLQNDPALLTLSEISYKTDKGGKLLILPKKDLVVMAGHKFYLDILDAVVMAFAPTTLDYPNFLQGHLPKKQFRDEIKELWEKV